MGYAIFGEEPCAPSLLPVKYASVSPDPTMTGQKLQIYYPRFISFPKLAHALEIPGLHKSARQKSRGWPLSQSCTWYYRSGMMVQTKL